MRFKYCIHISFALFIIGLTCVCTQKTYQLSKNGTLLLDPPPSLTDNTFLEISNPSYLSFIYSSANGISIGISTGVTPLLDATLVGNSSCILVNVFSETPNFDSSDLVTWLLGIILLSVLGCVMSMCIAITCCLVCLCRVVCGRCGAERTQNISPSCTLVNLSIYSPVLLAILVLTVLGCIFGLLSVISLNTNLSNASEIFDNTSNFINQSLSDVSSQLQFTFFTQFSATLEATAQQVQGHFDNAFDNRLDGILDLELGVDELRIAATDLGNGLTSASLLINSFDSSTSGITSRLEQLQDLCSTFGISCDLIPDNEFGTGNILSISSIISQLNVLSTTNSSNFLQNFTTPIVSQVNTLTSTFDFLDISVLSNAVDAVIGIDILSTFGSSFSVVLETYDIVTRVVFAIAIIIFPFIFVQSFLTLLGLVLALLGFDRRAKPSERTVLSDKGATILAISGYISMLSTWFLTPLLVTMFSLGSVMTTTCQPFLDRSILDYISPCLSQDVEVGNFGFTTPQLNLTEIFRSCENGESILSAVRADKLINNVIMNVSSRIDTGIDGIRGLVTPTVVSEEIVEGLMDAIRIYDPSNFNFTAVNNIINTLDNATITQRIDTIRVPILNLIAQIDNFLIRNFANNVLDELDEIALYFVAEADVIIANIISDSNKLFAEMNVVNETITDAIESVFQIASIAASTGFINSSFDSLDRNVDSYLTYVRDNIPTCTFLTDFYTGVVGIVCAGIIWNINAIWFCFGWILISTFSSSIFSFIISRYAVRRERETHTSPKSKTSNLSSYMTFSSRLV